MTCYGNNYILYDFEDNETVKRNNSVPMIVFRYSLFEKLIHVL